MTVKTPSLIERSDLVFPGGSINDFALPPERRIVTDRARGTLLWDSTGKRYVDFLLGSGPLVLGHGHPAVTRAITDQLSAGMTYYLPSRPAVELAEQICHHVPCAEAVRYCCDGSEAVFYAMRLARAYTGRSMVAKFEGGFHGHTDYALQSFAPQDPPRFPLPQPDSRGIPAAVTDTVLVVPYNDADALRAAAAEYGSELAAIVVEPVQRGIEPIPGFLAELRSVCDRIGALLVFDEVVTGFRLDMTGAQGLAGVTPDLCALGKAMSGGTPIACVAGRADLMSLYGRPAGPAGVYMSGTLNGNPLACAAGLATLRVMAEIDGCGQITKRGQQLQRGLSEAFADAGLLATTIGPPAFTDVVFGRADVVDYRDYVDSDRAAAAEFGTRMLDRGFLIRPGNKIYVSAVHTSEQIDSAIDAAREVLEQMKNDGALEERSLMGPAGSGPAADGEAR